MELAGLSYTSFLQAWKKKVANEVQVKHGQYYAYELQGFYKFSPKSEASLVRAGNDLIKTPVLPVHYGQQKMCVFPIYTIFWL